MAVLPEQDRQRVWRGLMRLWSSDWTAIGITAADLKAAVDATDDWIEANSANYNVNIPQPARNSMTAAQKTLMFMAVAAMRVSLEFARRTLGEVD